MSIGELLVEHLIMAGVGLALGIVTVRLRPGWLPTLALFVMLGWMVVQVGATYEPSVAMVLAGSAGAVGCTLQFIDRRRARAALRAQDETAKGD